MADCCFFNQCINSHNYFLFRVHRIELLLTANPVSSVSPVSPPSVTSGSQDNPVSVDSPLPAVRGGTLNSFFRPQVIGLLAMKAGRPEKNYHPP